MDRVVYVLGAGFSAPLGLPVISNFLMKSKDQYFSSPADFAYFIEVFKEIDRLSVAMKFFRSNLFNIEEILSFIEMRAELADSGLRDTFLRYIADVVRFHTPKIDPDPSGLRVGNWEEHLFGGEGRYGALVATAFGLRVKRHRVSPADVLSHYTVEGARHPSKGVRYDFITLNYDTILEDYAAIVTRYYSCPLVFAEAPPVKDDSPPSLAKLHGCVSKNTVVPPTWSKGVTEPIREAWRLAYDLLSRANHIRVIGYSFPENDDYVRYMLKASLVESAHLKSVDVLCLDPTGEVRARYEEFVTFPFFRFLSAKTEDYLSAALPSLTLGADGSACFVPFEERHRKFWSHRTGGPA